MRGVAVSFLQGVSKGDAAAVLGASGGGFILL
jgi:hypothetical protein